jgi:hypothetical protein
MIDGRGPTRTIRDFLCGSAATWAYGDGPPVWRQGRTNRPCKSAEAAAHDRELLTKALRRNVDKRGHILADLLGSCSGQKRCVSGACPECARAFQRTFVREGRNVFEACNQQMYFIDVVMSNGWIEPGQLDGNLFAAFKQRLTRSLADVEVPAIGGFSVTYNEHESGEFDPGWMPRAHLGVPARRMEGHKARFAGWYPASRETPRPFSIVRWGTARFRSYAQSRFCPANIVGSDASHYRRQFHLQHTDQADRPLAANRARACT